MEKAYTEVYSVLCSIDKKDFDKIPKSVIEYLKKNMDRLYNYKFDNRNLNISRRACAILVDIYMKYICNEKEKILMKEILDLNKQKNILKNNKVEEVV